MGPGDPTGQRGTTPDAATGDQESRVTGAVPLELYRVLADNAADTKITVSHIQLTAIKRADAELQHRTQLYKQQAQHAPDDQRTYYNLTIQYRSVQPTD